MFIAAAALPTVAAIYWLRNRFRRQPVSSLMLWVDHRAPKEGGARLQKLQTPLLFLLELLAVSLLVSAAAGPRLLASRPDAPLMVVLDDSFSMQAIDEGGRSARTRALEALRAELGRGAAVNARLVLAGATPQVIGEPIRSRSQAEQVTEQWRCGSPGAAIDAAITFASEIGGPRSRVLVLTDQPAPDELAGGRVEWWAFGRPVPNVAITNAARQPGDRGDRLLLEVTNLSAEPAAATLSIREPARERPLRDEPLSLGPRQTRRLVVTVPAEAGLIEARLGDDALAIDNLAILPPARRRPVAVQVAIRDESLRRSVRQALAAIDEVNEVSRPADLIVTDDPARAVAGPDHWMVTLLTAGDDVRSYLGPFVVDRAHPIGDGLSLAGVIWTAPVSEEDAGRPIVTAGNVPLVTAHERLGDRQDIRIHLDPAASTLTRTVNWPILWWNIAHWRASFLPGPEQTSARLGTEVTVVVDREATSLLVTDPSGRTAERPIGARRVVLPAVEAGLWSVVPRFAVAPADPPPPEVFAVNATVFDESDLSGATAERVGRWVDDPTLRRQYVNAAWGFALAALALLATHLWLVNRSSRAGVRT